MPTNSLTRTAAESVRLVTNQESAVLVDTVLKKIFPRMVRVKQLSNLIFN